MKNSANMHNDIIVNPALLRRDLYLFDHLFELCFKSLTGAKHPWGIKRHPNWSRRSKLRFNGNFKTQYGPTVVISLVLDFSIARSTLATAKGVTWKQIEYTCSYDMVVIEKKWH